MQSFESPGKESPSKKSFISERILNPKIMNELENFGEQEQKLIE